MGYNSCSDSSALKSNMEKILVTTWCCHAVYSSIAGDCANPTGNAKPVYIPELSFLEDTLPPSFPFLKWHILSPSSPHPPCTSLSQHLTVFLTSWGCPTLHHCLPGPTCPQLLVLDALPHEEWYSSCPSASQTDVAICCCPPANSLCFHRCLLPFFWSSLMSSNMKKCSLLLALR